MKIRFATLNDVPACIELGRRMHAITRFAAYDYNAERLAQNLRAVIEIGQNAHKTHAFFVVEDPAGQIVGALIGGVERHFFSDLLVASVAWAERHSSCWPPSANGPRTEACSSYPSASTAASNWKKWIGS